MYTYLYIYISIDIYIYLRPRQLISIEVGVVWAGGSIVPWLLHAAPAARP